MEQKPLSQTPQVANFNSLVINTRQIYPLKSTREDTIKYLNLILNERFLYNSYCNQNLIDLEKIIYLEEVYIEDEEIQQLIKKVKRIISGAYFYKKQYLNRISDTIQVRTVPELEEWDMDAYPGIPEEIIYERNPKHLHIGGI